MMNKLHGQPDSYDRKYVSKPLSRPYPYELIRGDRSKYRFGKTLGAGTYGIVREADSPEGKVAVKIILKKNVRGNEQMVYDEMKMLQKMSHPHIVKFFEWFESKVSERHRHE
jgi:calcium/calmodulin-dependent protein kinase I